MIFIFRIGSLGDSLVALPALYHIKSTNKHEKIILITVKKENAINTWDIFQYANVFDDVIYYDPSLIGMFKLVFKIRNFQGKKTLYYLPPFRTLKQVRRDEIVFKNLSGINEVIGLKESIAVLATRDKMGQLLKLESEYVRLLKIVLSKNRQNNELSELLPTTPLLEPNENNYKTIDTFLPMESHGKILIAIAHGTNMQSKKWDLENYKILMMKLAQQFSNIYFVLTGGKEDFNEAEYLQKKVKNSVNLAGKTSIIESAALLERCNLFIGNDTGTMHLASIMGTPVIGIYSARDNYGKWNPYGDNYTIIRKEVECAGCMLTECIEKEKKCLSKISIQEVVNLATGYLSVL